MDDPITAQITREVAGWDGVTVEQHRFGGIEFLVGRTPDRPALALLRVVAKNPKAVAEALRRKRQPKLPLSSGKLVDGRRIELLAAALRTPPEPEAPQFRMTV
jgi:hypothetical protein